MTNDEANPPTLPTQSAPPSARRLSRAGKLLLVLATLVVALAALMAGRTSCSIKPHRDAYSIHAATLLWMSNNPNKCPSIQDMLNDGVLDKSNRTTDTWYQPFHIVCSGEHAWVVSSGPDKKFATDDDIAVPSRGYKRHNASGCMGFN